MSYSGVGACELGRKIKYFFSFSFSFLVCLLVGGRVSLRGSVCPRTQSVDQAGCELRDQPASASQALA